MVSSGAAVGVTSAVDTFVAVTCVAVICAADTSASSQLQIFRTLSDPGVRRGRFAPT